EEGKLYREDGQWRSKAQSIAELGIPEGVRQVITRRLSRLSADTNKLMSTASAFSGGFRFDRVAKAAGIDESVALDAIDQALDAPAPAPRRRRRALRLHPRAGPAHPVRRDEPLAPG